MGVLSMVVDGFDGELDFPRREPYTPLSENKLPNGRRAPLPEEPPSPS